MIRMNLSRTSRADYPRGRRQGNYGANRRKSSWAVRTLLSSCCLITPFMEQASADTEYKAMLPLSVVDFGRALKLISAKNNDAYSHSCAKIAERFGCLDSIGNFTISYLADDAIKGVTLVQFSAEPKDFNTVSDLAAGIIISSERAKDTADIAVIAHRVSQAFDMAYMKGEAQFTLNATMVIARRKETETGINLIIAPLEPTIPSK